MLNVQICVGSSCHLKGSREIVELMQNEVEKCGLENEIELSGSFCTGRCNRVGVTITVNDKVFTGITVENFREFWNENILKALDSKGADHR